MAMVVENIDGKTLERRGLLRGEERKKVQVEMRFQDGAEPSLIHLGAAGHDDV